MYKRVFNSIGYFITVFLCFTLFGCANKGTTDKKVVDVPKLKEITVLKKDKETTNIYNIEDSNLNKAMEAKDAIDLKYNTKNNSYIFINNIEKGNQLNKNKITIIKNEEKTVLDNFYSVSDMYISKDGSKIAYRAFKEDSLESAQGMKIYDIDNKKEIKIKSDVLISGNLFRWLNEDEILYYGINLEKGNKAKIYKYNVKENSEEVYVDNIEGICTYFIPTEKDVLLLSRNGDSYKLSYYNKKKKEYKLISEEIDNIYKYTINENHNIFFLGRSMLEEKSYLYKIEANNKDISKVTYDFPTKIDINGGISIDKKGRVYFCGYGDIKEEHLNEIYMYNPADNAVEIISEKEGYHYITGEK